MLNRKAWGYLLIRLTFYQMTGNKFHSAVIQKLRTGCDIQYVNKQIKCAEIIIYRTKMPD